MHPIFSYLLIYMLLGAAGMYLGSRKKEKKVRKERWLKYGVYILITAVLIVVVLQGWFKYVVPVIVFVCAAELIRAGMKQSAGKGISNIVAFVVFGLAGFGCILFSAYFEKGFLLYIYFQVFIFDAFSQVTGQLFGRHRLLPSVSPAKTSEGLMGGIFFCLLSALIGAEWTGTGPVTALLYGCLTAAACFSGDTLASWYKRITGIKDYSTLLPGQGGFLDRFDSLIMTGAVYYFIFGNYAN